MNKTEFEKILTEITSVDLSRLAEVHSGLANASERFFVEEGKYRFEIKCGQLSFGFGIEMPECGPNKQVSQAYIRGFCEVVEKILAYTQSQKYLSDLAVEAVKMETSEAERNAFIEGAIFFRILLNFAVGSIRDNVALRCL